MVASIASIYGQSPNQGRPNVVSSASSGASFNDIFSTVSGSNAQSVVDTPPVPAQRPNVREFMDATGCSFEDASEIVYGTIGSNADKRDWAAIMASSDPLKAARLSTGAMYAADDAVVRTDKNATYMGADDTLARSDNFAVRLKTDESGKVVDKGLKVIDKNGLILRDAGMNPDKIKHNAWLFGYDTKQLGQVVSVASKVSPDLQRAIESILKDA